VLVLSLALPTDFSFFVGSLRLSPYRVVLLLAFIPAVTTLFRGKARPFLLADSLILFHLVWAAIVLTTHHGAGVALETGGVRLLELGGGYFVLRAYVVNKKTYLGFLAVVVLLVCVLAPMTMLESLTGKHLIREAASALVGKSFSASQEPRLGLHRAYGPFDHPILLGVFAASTFGLVWSVNRFLPRGRRFRLISVLAATISSVSSGALAALTTQLMLSAWERVSRKMKHRWRMFLILLASAYAFVDILSNRSAMKVFLYYLTFSRDTAYNRIIIFHAGMADVGRNPVLGLGLNMWTKPRWMHSDSMDNFWLVQAVKFGIPGFLSLALATFSLARRPKLSADPSLNRLRIGWTFSIVGLSVAGCTVHYWNASLVYFAIILGAGAWFSSVSKRSRR